MTFHDSISDLFGSDDGPSSDHSILYECRHCGTKFDDKPRTCSTCDATEIATYELREDPDRGSEDGDAGDGSSSDEAGGSARDEAATDERGTSVDEASDEE